MPKSSFSSSHDLRSLLHHGLLEMDLLLPEFAEVQLIKYIELIAQRNKLFKLISIVDKDTMVTRYLLDSLSLMPFINGSMIADVGTGAGFPGIPLAIAMPRHEFVLIDTSEKKTRFLKQACRELNLRNVCIVKERVEDYNLSTLFDTVVSRAFSTLHDFLRLSQHLTELEEVPTKFRFVAAVPVEVAGLNAQRHVVEFCYLQDIQK